MGKLLKILSAFIVVDFFFFSTPFTFSHGYNTKELLAVFGLLLYIRDIKQNQGMIITKELVGLILCSSVISFCAFASTTIHNTQESTYVTYFASMLVWLSAAYFVSKYVSWVHGRMNLELVFKYIVWVALVQGMIAVSAQYIPALDNFLLNNVPGLSWSKSVDRLYGFGATATLDTGGIRFAIASVLCMHLVRYYSEHNKIGLVVLYVFLFLVICVLGNMVARTTTVGSLMGLCYLMTYISPFRKVLPYSVAKTWVAMAVEIIGVFSVVVILYNTNDVFYQNTRFAFEGFFSLFEEGEWQTGSNDKLKTMYVFPDNAHTWILGDGYFINPEYDPNYLGKISDGFYMDTDVGYLRFIFYFGLIGLVAYISFILYAGWQCILKHRDKVLIMLCLTASTFVIWFKVATDCFFILALCICVGYVRDNIAKDENEELPENEEEDESDLLIMPGGAKL